MLRAVFFASILVASPAMARDLLAPGGHFQQPEANTILVAETTAEPFTATPHRPGYVCSIRGLGRTSTCAMRSWDERLGSQRLAER